MSNIHTLPAKNNKDEKKNNEEEFSTGGASSSTAVWRKTGGPGRDQGPQSQSQPQSKPQSQSSNDPMKDIIANAKRNTSQGSDKSGAEDRNIGTITVYKNGLVIGNDFRDSSDPKNAAFLQDLKKGVVPAELEAICRREWGPQVAAVGVNLVDKSSDVYTPPKPKFDFAKSQGQSLSGASGQQSGAVSFAHAIPKKIVVDSSQPTTAIQLVLHPRNRVKETFNQHHTVLDLYQHVMAISGLSGFDLVAGYPPKPVANPSQTLKDAGLLGASIQQRAI